MKAGELATIFRKTANILEYYENDEVNEVLDELLILVKKNSKPSKKNVVKGKVEQKSDIKEIEDLQEIINTLKNMDSKELERYLDNEKVFQSRDSLLKVAKEMSIVSSNSQTIAALKHSIIKYFERQNMDHIIRIERNE